MVLFRYVFGERNEAFDELACPSRAWEKCQFFLSVFFFLSRCDAIKNGQNPKLKKGKKRNSSKFLKRHKEIN